jgi:hydroxyacylglutathione hydrolase
MIRIKIFEFNPFQENTLILFDETKQCLIIDPGCYNPEENKELTDYIEKELIVPKAIINTHGHVDHLLGCKFIHDKYKVPFYTHKDDIVLIERAQEFGALFGIKVAPPPLPDYFLSDGQKFSFGNSELLISHVPGHSPGSIAIYNIEGNFVFTGDVLFRGSIGRTDLPGGNFDTLIESIKSKLLVLPREVVVYPGHGPDTTIGNEIDKNPFL